MALFATMFKRSARERENKKETPARCLFVECSPEEGSSAGPLSVVTLCKGGERSGDRGCHVSHRGSRFRMLDGRMVQAARALAERLREGAGRQIVWDRTSEGAGGAAAAALSPRSVLHLVSHDGGRGTWLCCGGLLRLYLCPWKNQASLVCEVMAQVAGGTGNLGKELVLRLFLDSGRPLQASPGGLERLVHKNCNVPLVSRAMAPGEVKALMGKRACAKGSVDHSPGTPSDEELGAAFSAPEIRTPGEIEEEDPREGPSRKRPLGGRPGGSPKRIKVEKTDSTTSTTPRGSPSTPDVIEVPQATAPIIVIDDSDDEE